MNFTNRWKLLAAGDLKFFLVVSNQTKFIRNIAHLISQRSWKRSLVTSLSPTLYTLWKNHQISRLSNVHIK